MSQKPKKSNSSKVNLTVSIIFHSAVILGLIYLAAREGILGKDLRTLAVTLEKTKKPDPPKVKPPEPTVAEKPKLDDAPKPVVSAPPPRPAVPPSSASDASSVVAPPPVVVADFAFAGGKAVIAGDANTVYKNSIERTLRKSWQRPDDMEDDNYAAEVELSVDSDGRATGYRWINGSGNPTWDNSVKDVLNKTKSFSAPPPNGFPGKFNVRFDVDNTRTEDAIQLSSSP
jgi:TonB family protein